MKSLWIFSIIPLCIICNSFFLFGQPRSFEFRNSINISAPIPTPVNHQHPRWSYDQNYLAFETLSQNEIHIYIHVIQANKFIEVMPEGASQGGKYVKMGIRVTNDLQWSILSPNSYYCIGGTKDERIQLLRGTANPKNDVSKANNVLRKDTPKVTTAIGDYSFVGFPKVSTYKTDLDAEILACIIGKEGDLELYILWYKSGIKNVTNVSNTKDVSEFHASFSSDSKSIVFAGDRINNNDIYVIRNVPNDSMYFDTKMLKPIPLTTNPSIQSHPSFCPTGGYIAFLSEEGHPKVKGLWIMDEDGRNQREIAPAVESTDLTGYSWHKDGRYIFYVKNNVKQLNPVAYYDLQENKEFILETGTAMNSTVVVSPKGDKIAFCAKGLKDSPNLTWSTVFYGDLILK